MQVPLRLSLTDSDELALSDDFSFEGAPWSVQLACQLLRQRSMGSASGWAPYVRALPASVPTPVYWPWDLISAVKYEPAASHLHETSWLVENAVSKLRGRSIGASPADAELSEEQADAFRCDMCFSE